MTRVGGSFRLDTTSGISPDLRSTIPATAPDPAPGRGIVTVEAHDGRSVVTRAYATSPLRLLTPRNHGRGAWIYTSSYGGGLVDGDRIALDVDVRAGACAFVSTQASTKVYRSRLGSSTSLTARVGDAGLLVAVPDPVVCFAESRYRQSQHVELAPNAGLVLVDWVTSGRRASGERWAFHEYISRLEVSVDAALVLYDSLMLRPDEGDLAVRMRRFDVLAVVLVVGAPLLDRASSLVAQVAGEPLVRQADRLTAAAMVSSGGRGEIGCVLRIAARSVEETARAIRQYLAFVPEWLGDDPWVRKW